VTFEVVYALLHEALESHDPRLRDTAPNFALPAADENHLILQIFFDECNKEKRPYGQGDVQTRGEQASPAGISTREAATAAPIPQQTSTVSSQLPRSRTIRGGNTDRTNSANAVALIHLAWVPPTRTKNLRSPIFGKSGV
jgi:hypothetical protein